ncbi:MAG: 23S rRNA (adenine(2030)-N(6))-methyltransferase RlmJ [Gammaproteobacteria bacterium]|nr:23S rRNA (adenine(2030)-N(6))-methyltransferase RlmJ [Gammaproteobacteria bacterium]
MLSYRHAFHAGNHADVLKHTVQTLLLEYLTQKDKPLWYIDTHSGAGVYDLQGDYARKTGEYVDGIARLWQRTDLPPALQHYVEQIKMLNPQGELRQYPGSAWIGKQWLRAEDKAQLFELHPTDFPLLQASLGKSRQVHCYPQDGLAGLKGLLPPAPRRALVLIDPPYEQAAEYVAVVKTLKDALTRFPQGVYAVWYPQLQRLEVERMLTSLQKLPVKGWLHARLTVHAPRADGFGMHGSGMWVINPPWTLAEQLRTLLPYLCDVLAQDTTASWELKHSDAE